MKHASKHSTLTRPRSSSSACKYHAVPAWHSARPKWTDSRYHSAGATKVKGFSHEVRSAELSSIMNRIEQEQVKNDEMIYKSPPALYAHIDNSPSLAQTLFQRIFGAEEAERLRGSRWAIINAWRPIKPVGRDPLGCCDTATVLDDDLVSVYARPSASWGNSVKDFTGQEVEIYNVKANPLHKWYFASDMQPDEVLLITNYDTNKSVDGHPLRVVHSALPYARDERAPPRESIELRALVVWEDQRAEES